MSRLIENEDEDLAINDDDLNPFIEQQAADQPIAEDILSEEKPKMFDRSLFTIKEEECAQEYRSERILRLFCMFIIMYGFIGGSLSFLITTHTILT